MALEKLNFDELFKVNMSKKLAAVEEMEERIKELEEAYQEKHQAYNNVGFMTADEIDYLFDKAKRKKQDIKG
eukprot:8311770-Ditylum_brightwellii.AAC.1